MPPLDDSNEVLIRLLEARGVLIHRVTTETLLDGDGNPIDRFDMEWWETLPKPVMISKGGIE